MSDIPNVGAVGGASVLPPATQTKPAGAESSPAARAADTYTHLPESGVGGIYSKDGAATVQKLWDEALAATETLRNIVLALITGGKVESRFGLGAVEDTGQITWARRAENPEIDPELREEAAAMIGEDGYYGVRQTTARILDFARALAGNDYDAQTVSDLRAGAKQGFDEVARMFGGYEYLPDVTKQTYDAVMHAFDDWANEFLTGE
ncbi:MAG: hypothetical protein LBI44_00250 [Oscillospiraceae bacterium]|jgi:hypothetical protein|nr:hypothetical protein [Oscillospiraceae bacterium]